MLCFYWFAGTAQSAFLPLVTNLTQRKLLFQTGEHLNLYRNQINKTELNSTLFIALFVLNTL